MTEREIDRQLRIELAAARLCAGYHDANDTNDDLRDPLVVAMIAYSLGADRLRRRDEQEAWDLYLVMIEGVYIS